MHRVVLAALALALTAAPSVAQPPPAGSMSGAECVLGDACVSWSLSWSPITGQPGRATSLLVATLTSPTREAQFFSLIYSAPYNQGFNFFPSDNYLDWVVGVPHTVTVSGVWLDYVTDKDARVEIGVQTRGPNAEQAHIIRSYSQSVSTVPEPATYALMATGLLALGGVGALRRRRAAAAG